MKLASARSFALSLPGVTEEPHHGAPSWRVRGKIFATVPATEGMLHVFLDPADASALAQHAPSAYEELWWGKKLFGLKVRIDVAPDDQVATLLEQAWRRKAPPTLIERYDGGTTDPSDETSPP